MNLTELKQQLNEWIKDTKNRTNLPINSLLRECLSVIEEQERDLNAQNKKAQITVAQACGWEWNTEVPGAWWNGKVWRHLLPEVGSIIFEWKEQLESKLAENAKEIRELRYELERISENLCGTKVEGEVKHDMVYCFVEGEIEKQAELKNAAENDQLSCGY